VSEESSSCHERVLAEYQGLAPEYDRKWGFYIAATTRETIRRLELRPRMRILDVGCGTGALLEELSRLVPSASLVGVEPVPGMLAVARRRLPATVRLLEGWAENLPCSDESFDLVLSSNVLHYISRPLIALREFLRVLGPDGQLVITDWCDDYLACKVCGWLLRAFRRAEIRTYGERECSRLLQEAGGLSPRVERYKISWLWGLMTASARKDPASKARCPT
jgi:ubiquinone/menaquinone biosynthesis C-methylase UbiE